MQMDLEELIASSEGIPASRSVLPGSEGARKMTAISGRKCIGSWLPSGPVGSLLKTLLVTSIWASTKCFLTWKVKNTPQSRLLYQLAPSMPRTDETGCGLWLTPRATDTGKGEKQETFLARMGDRSDRCAQSLAAQVQDQKLWPTPRTTGLDGGSNSRKAAKARGMWPTPTTRDYKGGRKPETLVASGRGEKNSLNDAVTIRDQHGSLNPTWVSGLMGFPKDWTEV